MLERLKSFLEKLGSKNSKNSKEHKNKDTLKYKHVLITIHGFGKKRSKEMMYIKEWGEQEHWNVVVFDMFEEEASSIPKFEDWMTCAYEKVKALIEEGYTVDVLGFSMGGVIASYLASQLPIRRLILLAPSFEFMSFESTVRLFDQLKESLLKDKQQLFIHELKERILPVEYWPQLVELVKKYGHYIGEVTCPVLFLHGTQDEAVPVRSSSRAFALIPHAQKRMFVIEGGTHQLMLDDAIRWDVFVLIRLFLDEEIVKVEKDEYNKIV